MRRMLTMAAAAALLLLASCSAASSPSTVTGASPGTAAARANPLAGMTASEIGVKAVADLKAAKSVHVAGSVIDSGQSIGLNLTLAGSRCSGVMSLAGTGSFRLIEIGKTVWLKPDNKFWKTAGGANPTVMNIVAGKWLKTTIKRAGLSDLATLCSPNKLAGAMFSGGVTGLVKGKTLNLGGQLAVQVKDTADAASAFVSETGTPEFLRIDSGNGQGRLDFTRYDAPVHIKVPSASATLDGAQYGF